MDKRVRDLKNLKASEMAFTWSLPLQTCAK